MLRFRTSLTGRILATALAALLTLAPLDAAANPFEGGWTLQPEVSSLNFQSVKNGSKVETSSFATFSGDIAPDGMATIRIMLESVDTKVDLRNVRMRFLFFESFRFPEATITAKLDPAMLADLETVRRKVIAVPYVLDLHGVRKVSVAEVVVTLLSDDMVAVATRSPISVAIADHDLSEGVAKLEEAASVTIVPSASVSFDFLFQRTVMAVPATDAPAPAAPVEPEKPASAALEAEGNFDAEACVGRFEILSRTGNIYFRSGSAALDAASGPLLDALHNIIARCPGMVIEVGGHTDSDGGASANLRLSETRARSVSDYLIGRGIAPDRIVSVGYGEANPVAPNDSAANKGRNRRIEFAVVSQ